MKPERPVLLYDADCRFCRWSARLVLRSDRDKRLAFLALQDDAATPLLASLSPEERLASWRLAEPGGGLTGRGEALGILLVILYPRLEALTALPLERLYSLVAGNRSRLGRIVADGPAPRRFP